MLVALLSLIRSHRAWWMLPIVFALVIIGLLAVAAATPAAPFIYPLF